MAPSQGAADGASGFARSLAASQPREQAFNAALKRSAIARDEGAATEPAGGQEGPAASSRSSSLAAEEEHLVAYGDSLLRGSAQKATASMEPTSAPVVPSSPRRTFLQQAGDAGGKTVLARIEQVSSPYVLQAGTVIPAILLTAITSDLPGDCMGQVTRDVFDSRTQRTLLIPKGSKLMCRYDDQVAAGQGRLLIAWTRLLLPDGRGMTLPGLALKDAQGQTGAKGDVDNHTRRVFGRALLLSAIGAGAQLSQPRQGSILAAPTTGQVAAGAVGQELSNVALEVLRRGMEQPPTITVQQGQTFNVFLNGDLVFDGPYESGQ
jgi:type IV secretion system protein VirB10